MAIVMKKQADSQGEKGEVFEADVVGLDHEGRGIVRRSGKAVFVHNALPGERVACRIVRTDKRFDVADAVEILRPSESRQDAPCPNYGECGGCSMQHIEFSAQVSFKQRVVEEQCARLGKISPDQILAPIYGLPWHYRERGRLGVQVDEQGRLKIGFRSKKSNRIVALKQCAVLPQHLSAALPKLHMGLQSFSGNLEGIEFAVAEGKTALCLIVLRRPSEKEMKCLQALVETFGEAWLWSWRSKNGMRQALRPEEDGLIYKLPDFNLKMSFEVGGFTQVNAKLNNLMVKRAMDLLQPSPGERIADLFCGLGNFTLPIARSGAQVLGVEGLPDLVNRAKQNAVANHCQGYVDFRVADLFKVNPSAWDDWCNVDKVLLDPPRAGAHAVIEMLTQARRLQRIVYVSCNPATFVRDAALLVGKGYRFRLLGVMNLFSQTAHIESIGCFDR